MSDYDVQRDMTLHLVLRRLGGMPVASFNVTPGLSVNVLTINIQGGGGGIDQDGIASEDDVHIDMGDADGGGEDDGCTASPCPRKKAFGRRTLDQSSPDVQSFRSGRLFGHPD